MVTAVATAALLCGGCAGQGAHASALEEHDLTVGAVPVADSAALYIAQQRHLFAAEGLHVKIVTVVSGATAIAGQRAGKFDVVLGNYVSYILADAHGDKFRVLAPGAADSPNDSMLMVPPGSPIQRVAQLKGATIGVNALNNIGTLVVTSVLYDNGIYVKRDHVHFKAIPFPDMSHALLTHQIDAAWMVEPFGRHPGLPARWIHGHPVVGAGPSRDRSGVPARPAGGPEDCQCRPSRGMGRPGEVREDAVVDRRPHRAARLPAHPWGGHAAAHRRPDDELRHAEPSIQRQPDAPLSGWPVSFAAAG